MEVLGVLESVRLTASTVPRQGELLRVSPARGFVVIAEERALQLPGSALAIEERWYPSTAMEDLPGIPEGKLNDTRLYRCLDKLLPEKTRMEQGCT